tara:strand:+ start:35 stop:514 length:480 start_codon:yes stop_codon:yes gene_type:complete
MKQFKLAVTFGRFNLLHKGHIDLFKQMADCSDEFFIGVSTGPNNLSYRNRADVIQKALNKDYPYGSSMGLFPKLQPFDLLREVPSTVDPEEVVFFVGEDQYKLAKAVERSLGFSTRIIPRLTSSTLVRQAIDNEEWDLLIGMIPGSIINDVIQLHLTNA